MVATSKTVMLDRAFCQGARAMKEPVNGAKHIYITEYDLIRLRDLLVVAREYLSEKGEYLDELDNELEQASIVGPEEIPSDVVTMNSTVVLKALMGEQEFIYSLVFPAEAGVEQNKVSIISPMVHQ
ncbi:GreA/GreB family elongation factor [Geobacter anodireducens]